MSSRARRRRDRNARKAAAAQKAAREQNRRYAHETQIILSKYELGPLRDITPNRLIEAKP